MNKPIEAFMRVGIVHFMAFPELASGAGPWEETVRGIALDPFFDAIEVTHIEAPEVRDRVKALLDLANMGLGYAAHPSILGQGLNINAVEEDVRTRACTVLKERLDEAIYMGAENFLILSGKDPGVEMRSQAVDALIGSLEELCAYSSSKQGPKVVVEAFDTEVDKCCLLGPSSMAREVAQEVSKRQSNFGLLVDLSHIPLLKESPEQALEPVKEYLAGVHLGNAVVDPAYPGYGDNHPVFGTPGGANDVPEVVDFLKTLLKIGFLDASSRPIVSFEIKPMEGQDPMVIIANAKRVLKQAWAMV
jgi:sugar phosphate isomerase/epimerase